LDHHRHDPPAEEQRTQHDEELPIAIRKPVTDDVPVRWLVLVGHNINHVVNAPKSTIRIINTAIMI